MEFPSPVIWVGDCCYRVPLNSSRRPRVRYPDPSLKDEYTGVVFEGERWQAHRLSHHLNIFAIPRKPESRKKGMILHNCDHKWCINPAHIYLGTAKQNAIDNASRNVGWRETRREIQKKIGFPEVSKEGRARAGKANSDRLKAEFAKDPKPFLEKAKAMREVRLK